MLNLISWDGPIRVNGVIFVNSTAAYEMFKDSIDELIIELNYREPVLDVDENEIPAETEEYEEDYTIYKVRVKQYMTKPSTPEFNFHDRWNEGKPMPMRTMYGLKIGETKGMLKMDLFAKPAPSSQCMVCGRTLTHPVSLLYGIGPECGCHFHINPYDTEEELQQHYEELKNKMADISWEGWIPRSAILEFEVIKEEE